jgi:hypothetical protein
MSSNSTEHDLAAESTAQGGTDKWLMTDLTADTYLLAIFKPPADEPEASPVARVCHTDSDLVDALFMHATNMTALYLLLMKPEGANLVPRLLTVVDVVRCEVPERGNRLVTRVTTSCGLHLWVPGAGTLDSLEPSYRICCFQA